LANYGSATKVEYSRWLGLVDQSDPTNLPTGCAAVAKNIRFTLTEIETRWGLQTAIQGLNQSPITGLLGSAFTPESALQSYFQSILLYDYTGALQIETPTGSGATTPISSPLVPLPAQSHMIGSQAYNRAWMSFSDLLTPTAFPAAYDLQTKALYPYGMKPVGFGWYAGALVLVGECTTPSILEEGVTVAVGNGHLYICTVAGKTGQVQPAWPLTEGGTVIDGTVTWKEQTPVLANRLPAPLQASIALSSAASGIFAAWDVYVILTFVNAQGESLSSVARMITTVLGSTAVVVTIPTLGSLAGWIQGLSPSYIPTGCNVYYYAVATGAQAPQLSKYGQLTGSPFPLGGTATIISTPPPAIPPPTTNSARVTGGQLPTPDVEPITVRNANGGAFPAFRDVYVLMTYLNAIGETTPGPANSVIDTQLNDAMSVTVQFPIGYAVTSVNIYECDVPTGTVFDGSMFPPFANFALVGNYPNGATVNILNSATGHPPPTVNTTGPGGNIAQDTATGGPNGTQGLRWAIVAYQDMFDTISGIRQSAAFGYDVDENGWELGIFNLPTGPSYIKNVIVGFTVADGLSAGPFGYIPRTMVSDGIPITATIFPNGTKTAVVNFTDEYMAGILASAATNITDRLRVIQPQQCVDLYYSESTNRIFQSCVPGFYTSHWVSLAADPESYYGDTSLLTVGADDGERAWCVREYRGTLYSLRERSGFEVTPSTADPATWVPTKRWQKVGPCGPRAVDVCGNFIIFVHSSGIYKYADAYPELVSKELPRWWNTINWKAAQYIWCAIDVEQHEVRMGFPVGASMVPNVVLTLNYEEGWAQPLLFSRYSQKEITIEACRKYSVDDIQGFVGGRYYRAIPGQPDPVEGPVDITEQVERQYISQYLIASSGPDGTVQAITPGVYNDNGAGIDCQYETVAAQQAMTLCKLAGINLNARGNGSLFVSFLAGANRVTDWQGQGDPPWEVKLRPFQLDLNPTVGLSRGAPSRLSERWRTRFTNGAIPDAWFSIKYACLFISPMFGGREALENK
jgi:hypothetical protein